MSLNPHRWRTGAIAAVLAAMAAALPMASCGGGKAAGLDPDSPIGRLQAQILALEAAQQENGRLMGQALSQNAQMRGDVAAALARNRELEQRLAALEARNAVPAPTAAEYPVEQSPEPTASSPRRTPVAVRMPGDAPARPASATTQRLTVNVRSGDGWQPLYVNPQDRSQKVRVKRMSAGTPAQIRLAPTGAAETSSGPRPPMWDLPGAGAEKWLRIGCGQEISARADAADFEVLVREDRNPDICAAKSAGMP